MSHVVIPTSDRPGALNDCLGSLVAPVSESEAVSRVLVFDDSTRQDNAEANRRIVGRYSRAVSQDVAYIGFHEKLRLIDAILGYQQRAVPRHVLEWAIMGDPRLSAVRAAGGSRNTALLLSAGSSLISMDDDASFRFSELRGRYMQRAWKTLSDQEFRSHYITGAVDSVDTINKLSSSSKRDVLDEMLCVLGAKGTETHGPNHRVRLSMTGILGKRWYDRPIAVFYNSDDVRRRVYQRMDRYQRARLAGFGVMQSPTPVMTGTPFFVSCCCGFDACSLLPPFPSAGRAQDTIFAWVLKQCFPTALTAHVPCMVHHDVDGRRPVKEEDFKTTGANFSAVTTALIQGLASVCLPRTGEDAMDALGRQLRHLSQLSHQEWVEHLHRTWLHYVGGVLAGLERRLERFHGKPDYWAQDVAAYIQNALEESTDPVNAIPVQLRASCLAERATELHRDFFRSYGELLTCWPEIWTTATALNEDILEVIK